MSEGSGKMRGASPGNRLSSGSLYLTLPPNFSPSSGGSPSPGSHSPGATAERKGSAGSRGSPLHHYTWEDFRRLFLVSLNKMSRMEPESVPFRQPVDPEELGLDDYFDIIRKPMDLQTIRNKMNSGKYTEPYAYVDDVLLMLDNAWLYNRVGSKVYEYCTRLAALFIDELNPVMTHLGYKLGRTNSYEFNSNTVTCHGRPVCLVVQGRGYWRDTSRDMEFNLCEQCYEATFGGRSSPVAPDVVPCSRVEAQQAAFVFSVNNCKAYSPAVEFQKSHLRDAEMSRQLVLREFLRLLISGDADRKSNVFKMLKSNPKLLAEFSEYVKRRKSVALGEGPGIAVVTGESFTTQDLDSLLADLKGLRVTETKEPPESTISDSGVDSVLGSSVETLDLSLETSCSEDALEK